MHLPNFQIFLTLVSIRLTREATCIKRLLNKSRRFVLLVASKHGKLKFYTDSKLYDQQCSSHENWRNFRKQMFYHLNSSCDCVEICRGIVAMASRHWTLHSRPTQQLNWKKNSPEKTIRNIKLEYWILI